MDRGEEEVAVDERRRVIEKRRFTSGSREGSLRVGGQGSYRGQEKGSRPLHVGEREEK